MTDDYIFEEIDKSTVCEKIKNVVKEMLSRDPVLRPTSYEIVKML